MNEINTTHFGTAGRDIAPHYTIPERIFATILRSINSGLGEQEVIDRLDPDNLRHSPECEGPEASGNNLADVDLFFCGGFDDQPYTNLDQIGAFARSSSFLTSYADLLGNLQSSLSTRILAVIQVRNVLDSIDRLSVLRRNFPQVGILLVSSSFKANDFSGQRRAICDASLQDAGSYSLVAQAVNKALANHRDYLMRGLY